MELKGQKACMGTVSAKAFVIYGNSSDEINAFEEGCILVTRMTTPEFTHIFNKAKGIITETGGILSHAAIVSREYNIPCLVGVNGALINILTGDLITLDVAAGKVLTVDRTEQETKAIEKKSRMKRVSMEVTCDYCGGNHEVSECEDCTYCADCDSYVHNDHEHLHCDYCDTEMEHDTSDCPHSFYCDGCGERVDNSHVHAYCDWCENNDHDTSDCEFSKYCEKCDNQVALDHEHSEPVPQEQLKLF